MVDDSAHTPEGDLTLEPASAATSSHRRALWAVLAVIAVVTGTVVVSSSDDSGPPRLPVALGSSSREAGTSAMSADMSVAWVTYVAGKDLPALGGNARAYLLDSSVDEGRVRALANALGLQGDPTREGDLWRVTAGDAVLEVYEDNGSSWWYSANQGVISSGGSSAGCDPEATECAFATTGSAVPATTVPAEECRTEGASCASDPSPSECPPDPKCAEPSQPPEAPCATDADCGTGTSCPPDTRCALPDPIVPPADLPSKAEARQVALDLLGATGMDVGDAKVTVDGPSDAWYVNVEPVVDGLPVSGWVASVSVGSKGAIVSASGSLATLERLSDYPLIDTRAAIERLNEMQGGFGGGPVPLGAPDGVSRDVGVATLVAPVASAPCPPDDPSCSGVSDTDDSRPPIVSQCKVQPDGSEICESVGSSVPECPVPLDASDPAALDPVQGDCAAPGICYTAQADSGGVAETTIPSPECTEPIPYPQPKPIEVTLTDAERVLTLMPAYDGSGDAYLVPGYRFSNAEGVIIDVPAVDDDSLAPTTTVPDITETKPVPPVAGPGVRDPRTLEPGQTPEIGVGYYVDVTVMTHCSWVSVEVANRWWWAELPSDVLADWSTPTEGGTFTLVDEDHADFVGDYDGIKAAKLIPFGDGTQPPECR